MSHLDHMWDDTVAGPCPASGLRRLRRVRSSPASDSAAPGGIPVTRSITVLRPGPVCSAAAAAVSDPSSPASLPSSPLTPTTPKQDCRRLQRLPAAEGEAGPRFPDVYDWLLISAMDK